MALFDHSQFYFYHANALRSVLWKHFMVLVPNYCSILIWLLGSVIDQKRELEFDMANLRLLQDGQTEDKYVEYYYAVIECHFDWRTIFHRRAVRPALLCEALHQDFLPTWPISLLFFFFFPSCEAFHCLLCGWSWEYPFNLPFISMHTNKKIFCSCSTICFTKSSWFLFSSFFNIFLDACIFQVFEYKIFVFWKFIYLFILYFHLLATQSLDLDWMDVSLLSSWLL